MFPRRQVSIALVTGLSFALLACGSLFAWSFEGHRLITRSAISALGPEVPLNRDRLEIAVEGSVFPDLTRPISLPQLRDVENPQHYINVELLNGRPLPPTRSGYVLLISNLADSSDPPWGNEWTLGSIGVLPYVLVEATQRLASVFRQLRVAPDDERLLGLVLHYAGVLSHYSGDLCQPLHTTIHHNGRSRPDGSLSQTGLHDRVDRLFETARLDNRPLTTGVRVDAYEDLFAEVLAELALSNSLVDRVYELEPAIELVSAPGNATRELERFVDDRLLASVRFTANLIQTAWVLSEAVELPGD